VLTGIGFVWYVLSNIRAGRPEIASEIELAPNRKPYYDDEGLEGPRLTRALSTGFILLAVVAVGLPLYWLNEPSRQSGAIENFDQTFVNRGAKLFAPTADGGYNCAGCHGDAGVGGSAPFTLTDADAKFVATVTWQAPALNTVLLRFNKKEVRDILTYGRPGTPMPAWGAEGGGPLTTQQIDELIAYLRAAMPTMRDTTSTVGREVELVRAWLGIAGLRLGEPISVDLELPEALSRARMPAMMLLPLVDRAIAHGDRSLRLRATAPGPRIRIAIAGVGIASLRDSEEVAAVRERLTALYGAEAGVELSASGETAEVVLTMPADVGSAAEAS
jgi:mono/diheme cytochrome c family protein